MASPAPKSTKPLDGSPSTDTAVKGYWYIVNSCYSEVLYFDFSRLQLALSVRSAPATRTIGLRNMCEHPSCRSAPPGGPDRHQSSPSDSCNFGCQLYNEPVYIGGPGKMPDFSVLQHGAAVMFQYRSKTGTSATELRYAIVGPRGVNAETPHGRPNDTRPGYWMRYFDREQYGPGNSRVKFYYFEPPIGTRVQYQSMYTFARQLNGSTVFHADGHRGKQHAAAWRWH